MKGRLWWFTESAKALTGVLLVLVGAECVGGQGARWLQACLSGFYDSSLPLLSFTSSTLVDHALPQISQSIPTRHGSA